MQRFVRTALVAALASIGLAAQAQELVIATVNNGHMIEMQKLTPEFEKANPGIKLKWVTLEEGMLRSRVTTDIATKGGQYDVVTVGNYEVPIWGKQGWLAPLEFGADYDVDDLLPAIRGGLTVEDKLYAAPFYGESAMIMYRTDLFEKAGLTMPANPTWEFIGEAARDAAQAGREARTACTRWAYCSNGGRLPISPSRYTPGRTRRRWPWPTAVRSDLRVMPWRARSDASTRPSRSAVSRLSGVWSMRPPWPGGGGGREMRAPPVDGRRVEERLWRTLPAPAAVMAIRRGHGRCAWPEPRRSG